MGNVPGQLGTFSEDLRAEAQRATLPGQGCFGCAQVTKAFPACHFPGVGDHAREAGYGIWPAPHHLFSNTRETLASEGLLLRQSY